MEAIKEWPSNKEIESFVSGDPDIDGEKEYNYHLKAQLIYGHLNCDEYKFIHKIWKFVLEQTRDLENSNPKVFCSLTEAVGDVLGI